jgi:hypothetical protein
MLSSLLALQVPLQLCCSSVAALLQLCSVAALLCCSSALLQLCTVAALLCCSSVAGLQFACSVALQLPLELECLSALQLGQRECAVLICGLAHAAAGVLQCLQLETSARALASLSITPAITPAICYITR